MEDPPQPQDMIINTRGSLQVQSQIVEISNPELVPEKIQSALQSTSTTAPSAVEVCVDIPLDDPLQDTIINTCSSRQQTTAPPAENDDGDDDGDGNDDDDDDDDDVQEFIRRVPTHMHKASSGHLYEPAMLSIGPYHHNKPQYSEMERFKKRVLDTFMEESVAEDATKDRNFYYGKIFERIDEIRGYYQGVGPKEYTDEALTELILCDARFLVSYMQSSTLIGTRIISELGSMSIFINVEPDLFRVENQIPFLIINQLLHLRFSEEKAPEIVREFVSLICFSDRMKLKSLPWEDEQPLHLVKACQATLWKRETASKPKTQSGEPDQSMLEKYNTPNRSVTYLQTKGIYLRPSSESLKDITFTSHRFYGVLHLPIFFVDNNTMVLLQNLVAFEDSLEGFSRADVASYVNFMNTIIDTSKDVKQLRERGILYSDLRSDEEVFKVFKQINTYGIINYSIFNDVKWKINKHCKSRSKTWIADLLQNYCRGPWAAIGILAATAVLCLTAVQVYYAVHPKQ